MPLKELHCYSQFPWKRAQGREGETQGTAQTESFICHPGVGEGVEGRGLQGKVGSNASYCRKLWLCRGKQLLSERHWNSSGTGQSNHRIESRLCFVSSSDQRMLIT